MTIRVECKECQSKLPVADNLQGKQIRCPKCKALISVPLRRGRLRPGFRPGFSEIESRRAQRGSFQRPAAAP